MASQQWQHQNMVKSNVSANQSLGKNLQFLMDRHPALKSQTKVALKTGISQSTVGRILRGEVDPAAAALNRIAEEFQIEVGDLHMPADRFAEKHTNDAERGAASFNTGIREFSDKPLRALVPVLDWKQVITREGEPFDWLICPVRRSPESYALKVQGVAMFNPSGELSFREGDDIFVDPKCRRKHKSLVIVRIGNSDEAVFRQIIADGDRWMLLQLNPSWPNRVTEFTENDTILGVVIAKVESYL